MIGHNSADLPYLRLSFCDSGRFRRLGGGLRSTIYWVGYVPVRFNSKDTPADELVRSAPSKFSDPLFEESSFALPAGETTPVWITVSAPAGTKPGIHEGDVVFHAGKRSVANARFRIQVSSATVPAKQKLRITNWFDVDGGTSGDTEGGHLMSRSKGYDSPLILPAFVVENGEVRSEDLSPDDPRAEDI